MDVLSQGVVGAVFAQSVARKKEVRSAFVIGFIAGLAADADVFIRSSTDTILSLQYHRHFTHSLVFIPLGASLAFLLLWPFFKKRVEPKRIFIFALAGYATHALLDACTSYGTLLLWPFSEMRVAFSIISIIDPVFTFTVLGLSLWAFFKQKTAVSRLALPFIFLYFSLGFVQKYRVQKYISQVAKERGHRPARIYAKPTIGNLILWKSFYQHRDHYYTDALRAGFLSPNRFFAGKSIEKLDLKSRFPKLPEDSVLFKDIKRFAHFSDDHLVLHPRHSDIIVDFRYTLLPNTLDFLWGIKVDSTSPQEHARYLRLSTYSLERRRKFFQMLFDRTD